MKSLQDLLAQTLIGALAAVLIFTAYALYVGYQAREARFAVDALEQYLQSYRRVEKKSIERLSELPDFYLIAPSASLSLRAKDIKQGIHSGYVYDLQYVDKDKFVISASPVGLFSSYEFGITDKGILRMNNKNVDAEADSYTEVETWPIITREERIQTKDLPAYLR